MQTHAWEHQLLSLANEALHYVPADLFDLHQTGSPSMVEAYEQCRVMTSYHSKSFFLASALLPPEKKRAVRALYAFCRITDDIVDCGTETVAQDLAQWRRRSISFRPPEDDLVALAWADTRRTFHIPNRYAEQLIDGVARDMQQTRYQTFEDLTTYAYGVASTVGLMSMHIVGFRGPEAIPYAIKLGVALQLTNILRDVGEDWRNGRLYLPADEMTEFGLDEAFITAGQVDDRWRAFMRFQIERNRQLYAEAWPGIAMLAPDGRFAIAAAARLYEGILKDIERHDYDVFSRRAFVNKTKKLAMLPAIWWGSRTVESKG